MTWSTLQTLPNKLSASRPLFLTSIPQQKRTPLCQAKPFYKYRSQNACLPYSATLQDWKSTVLGSFLLSSISIYGSKKQTKQVNVILRSVSPLRECIDFWTVLMIITANMTGSYLVSEGLAFKTDVWAGKQLKMETPQKHIKFYPARWHKMNEIHPLVLPILHFL